MITLFIFFFFNDTATTEIYTLSLHDALPISAGVIALGYVPGGEEQQRFAQRMAHQMQPGRKQRQRSEEHTSELQSHSDLVCRLLLEKKKKKKNHHMFTNIIRYV